MRVGRGLNEEDKSRNARRKGRRPCRKENGWKAGRKMEGGKKEWGREVGSKGEGKQEEKGEGRRKENGWDVGRNGEEM